MDSSICDPSVRRIVRGMSEIQGGERVSITSRRFPRLLPAEPGTGYVEQTVQFEVGAVPEDLPVPQDADETFVTLQGSMGPYVSKSDLLQALHQVFQDLGVAQEWITTAAVMRTSDQQSAFHVLVERDLSQHWDA